LTPEPIGPLANQILYSWNGQAANRSRQAQNYIWKFQLTDLNPNNSEVIHSETVERGSSSGAAPSAGTVTPSRPAAWISHFRAMFVRRLLIVGVLGAMVMVGLFLANFSSDKALYYWCAMFPIFGIVGVAHQLALEPAGETPLWRILLRQALHWIAPIIVVKILFMQHQRGQMSTDAVAITTILVLAVTCFLAGVHYDGSFCWISALLVLAALIGTEIETYLWLVVLLFLLGVALVILSLILLRRVKAASTQINAPA
jgi:hypothetical protein